MCQLKIHLKIHPGLGHGQKARNQMKAVRSSQKVSRTTRKQTAKMRGARI